MSPTDIAKILDELTLRFGPTGGYVYQLAIREVYVESGLAIAWLGVGILIGLLGLVVTRKTRPDKYVSNDDKDNRDLIVVVLSTFYACSMVIATMNFAFTVGNLFNPEFAAIRLILRSIGAN